MLTSLLLTLAPLSFAPPAPSFTAAASDAAPLATTAPLDEFKDRFKEAGKDADKLWTLYQWTLEDPKRKKYGKRVLSRLVKAHPDHREAREALGHIEYDGKWYESQKALDKAMKKIAKETGLVRFNDDWVPVDDVPYLKRGLKKDERGQWFDPVEKQRLAEGWKKQDLVWIKPDDIGKMDEGLWNCDGKWLPLDAANDWHNDLETPWKIPTKRAVIWSTATRETAMKAAKQAEAAYYDMQKVFAFGGDVPVPFMLVRNQEEYLRFMDGSEEYELPQLDPIAMASMNRAAFADLWFDFEEEVYNGMGVTYWDTEDQYGDNYGIHDARFAYALSYVEQIDPVTTAAETVLADGEVGPEFAETRIREHRLPRWFRWGAASYASRWFKDTSVGRGGDPFWARKWSAQNLSGQGGLLPMEEFFAFDAHAGNPKTTQMLNQAGLMVAYLVDGGNKELAPMLRELQTAMEKREDTEKIFESIRNELSSKEEQIRAFAGL